MSVHSAAAMAGRVAMWVITFGVFSVAAGVLLLVSYVMLTAQRISEGVGFREWGSRGPQQ